MLGEAGIPTVALWAQVPHYLAAGPSPPAIRAVLAKVRDLGGLEVDLAASTTRRRPTCSGSRRASPTVPTSSR